MATYAGIYDKAHNIDFVNRVEVAMVQAAIAISAEAGNVVNHANRVALARDVLMNPVHYSGVMAVGVATDSNVQGQPTDQNLASAIASQWNAYAGVA